MQSVVLISSNPTNKPPRQNFDLYVHFNGAIHFDKTPAEKSLIMTRSRKTCAKTEGKHCHAVCPDLCYLKIGSCDADCKIVGNPKTIVVIGRGSKINLSNNMEILDRRDVPSLYYSKEKSPTTGFIGIYYFLSLGFDVSVLDFDLKQLGRGSSVHDFEYEQRIVEQMILDKRIHSV